MTDKRKNRLFDKETQYDGRPELEIKSFDDLIKLQEYRDRRENVRVIISPHTCTDNYDELCQAINQIAQGVTTATTCISLRKEKSN